MSLSAVLLRLRHLGLLAIVLAAMLLAVGGRAEAADHGPHGAHHAQAHPAGAQSAAVHAHAGHAAAQTAPDGDNGAHPDGGIHHGGDCHCLSAACVPALPSFFSDLRVFAPRSRHALPVAMDALALAGVDPPAEPPRL